MTPAEFALLKIRFGQAFPDAADWFAHNGHAPRRILADTPLADALEVLDLMQAGDCVPIRRWEGDAPALVIRDHADALVRQRVTLNRPTRPMAAILERIDAMLKAGATKQETESIVAKETEKMGGLL